MHKKEIIFILSMFLVNTVLSQTDTEKKSYLPTIGLGIGVSSFYGDLGETTMANPFSGGVVGYHFNITERLGFIGVSLGGLKGKVSGVERTPTRNLNFETNFLNIDLKATFFFDNGFIIRKDAVLAPYLSAGIGFLSFDPKADLKDKNGVYYHYWQDGTIRDQSQQGPNNLQAVKITRDYAFETTLPAAGDSLNSDNINYSKSAISIPISGGILFKLSPSFHINIGATYYMTQTDWLDNLSSEGKGLRKGESGNDGFLYSSVGLHYNIKGGSKDQGSGSTKSEIDFVSIDNADADQDGVKDVYDNCPETPKDVKVDSKGCPKDSDSDGIFDYLDQEPNTKKGMIVDANGVTLKDDNLVMEQEATARFDPNDSTQTPGMVAPKPSGALPEMYQEVDLNKDGKISTEEINSAIDNFFEGNTKLKIDGIYGLIDYFFEQ